MNQYEKQAASRDSLRLVADDFLESTGTSIELHRIGTYARFSDMETDVYKVTIKNDRHSYTFDYSDSLHNTQCRQGIAEPFNMNGMTNAKLAEYQRKMQRAWKKPSIYDILACLDCYDAETFDDFCSNFGYDTDSRKALETYLAAQEEYSNLTKLFTSEQLDQLMEIA